MSYTAKDYAEMAAKANAEGKILVVIEGELVLQDPPAPTLEEIIAGYETNIQTRLDDFARTLTYDGMLSACTYATSTVDMYRIEGQYCVDARDATWAKAYELLSAILPTVQAGGEIPTWEEIEAELPPLAWPEGSRGWQPPAEPAEPEA